MKATYALTANKVKSQGTIDRSACGYNNADCLREQALMRFTRKYFQSHQPATLEDFVWWSGLNVLLLIPPYDEYLIGFKSRDIVLPPEHRHRAHNNSGIFQPIIARDGIVCGNWSPFREDCQVDFFDGSNNTEGLQEAWASYQRFRVPG